MTQDNQVPSLASSDSLDVFGVSGVSKYLLNPIIRGVGHILSPLAGRLDNEMQIANFNSWVEAAKAKGFSPQTMNLTLGQRAEIQMLATAIEGQNNSELIAAEAIGHAKREYDPGDTIDVPPLDDDWIDHFWRLARKVSNRDMQSFWGLVLARKAAGKNEFSARALEFLSTLNGDEARVIERLAPMVIRLEAEPAYWNVGLLTSLPVPYSQAETPLTRFRDLPRTVIGNFEHDLFSSIGLYLEGGYAHSFIQAPFRGRENVIEFSIGNRVFGITGPVQYDEYGNYNLGSGTGFSPLGKEIFGMLNTDPNPDYVRVFREWCALNGWQFHEPA